MANPRIGEVSQQISDENRRMIEGAFKAYPSITQTEVSELLKLSRATVNRHVKAIRAGWKPE